MSQLDPLTLPAGSVAEPGEKPASGDKRQSRKRPESRAKLLAAARKLFVARGYHDTRPQDISKAADVGHGTFYLHFPDKRACFFAFMEEACAELDQAIDQALDGVEGLGGRIECVLRAVIDYHLNNPGVLSAALSNPGVIGSGAAPGEDHRAQMLGHWARSWSAKLSAYADKGVIHGDYDFDIVGWIIVGMFNPLCTARIATPENRDEVVANMKRLLMRGLAVPEAG